MICPRIRSPKNNISGAFSPISNFGCFTWSWLQRGEEKLRSVMCQQPTTREETSWLVFWGGCSRHSTSSETFRTLCQQPNVRRFTRRQSCRSQECKKLYSLYLQEIWKCYSLFDCWQLQCNALAANQHVWALCKVYETVAKTTAIARESVQAKESSCGGRRRFIITTYWELPSQVELHSSNYGYSSSRVLL